MNKPASVPLAVSVIVPAYNTEAYIAEALDSVFAQTFPDFEVIVINDGSPDTETLKRVLAPFHGRIVYLQQENGGCGSARNLGIRHARGEFIAFLDSDDCWLPEYLAAQVKMFEDTPSLDMVYCDAFLCGDSTLAGKSLMEQYPPIGPTTFENVLSGEMSILTCCTVVRRQVLLEVGLFDENLVRAGDYDLWFRVSHHGARIGFHRKVLARRRYRAGSLSSQEHVWRESLLEILKSWENKPDLRPTEKALVRREILQLKAELELRQGKLCLLSGDFAGAYASLGKANSFFRRRKLHLALLGLRFAPRATALAATAWVQFLHHIKSLTVSKRNPARVS
jgi:glycosyltransferase involved in cell wall biosynthesis